MRAATQRTRPPGWFYQKAFAPPTYYRLDTMYMFQSAVQSAMLECINGLLTAKGCGR